MRSAMPAKRTLRLSPTPIVLTNCSLSGNLTCLIAANCVNAASNSRVFKNTGNRSVQTAYASVEGVQVCYSIQPLSFRSEALQPCLLRSEVLVVPGRQQLGSCPWRQLPAHYIRHQPIHQVSHRRVLPEGIEHSLLRRRPRHVPPLLPPQLRARRRAGGGAGGASAC